MKKNKKRLGLSLALIMLLFTLSGCVQTYKTGKHVGEPTGDGWVYNLLVEPMSHAVQFFADHLALGYGLGIIVVTIIVRLCILPLGLHSSKKMMIQQQKMMAIQPEIQRLQKLSQRAASDAERMKINMAMTKLMKDNDISMFGGMGCLPLLIQMPFFTALFYAARYTPGINQANFLGINLGTPSLLLTLLAGGSYLLQGYLSSLSLPKEQRKQMRITMIMSPMMIVFMSFSSPAGVTLYWVVGGLISCLQVLITNFYHKPKIERQIKEELKKNPPTTHIDVDGIKIPDMQPKEAHPVTENHSNLMDNYHEPKDTHNYKRNAGKQQQRHTKSTDVELQQTSKQNRNADKQHDDNK